MSTSAKSSIIKISQPSDNNQPELQKWFNQFQSERFLSIRNDIIWRLPLLYLLFGVSLGFIISYQAKIGNLHTYFIMCGIAFILCMQLFINKVSNIDKLYDTLYLICGMTIILPLGFLVTWQFDYFFLLLIFFIQSMCWMLFPWSLNKSLGWAIFLLAYWTIILNLKQFNFFNFLPLSLVLIISVGISRLRFQELNLYQSSLFLTKLCSVTQNSFSLCLQFCRLILCTYDSAKALLLMPNGDTFKIEDLNSNKCQMSSLSAQSIYTNLKDKGAVFGHLKLEKQDLDLKAFIYDCLSTKASKFKYYFIQTAHSNIEIDVLLLIPVLNIFDNLRMPRLLSGIKSLFDIYNMSMITYRNQTMSNDTVLAYGTDIADREGDINHIVHTVNNSAQEISIHCDSIKRLLTTNNQTSEISVNADLIENSIKQLTQNVSDIKLIREIATLRSFTRVEKVALGSLLSKFELFLSKYANAEKFDITFTSKINSLDDGVQIPSSEYLETVLRFIANSIFNRLNKSGKILFSASCLSDQVILEFNDNGAEITDKAELKVVEQFCNFSKGNFEIFKSSEKYINQLKLTLPYCKIRKEEMKESKKFTASNWMLFVDDNQQIITFYSRIAEALGMHYTTAASYQEAVTILQSKGKPRLVITDIQLINSSGLDLVVYLRSTFKDELPIIVVSGNDDVDVSSRAYSAGANKYLKKPLGRQKLFSEIEGLLK